jgi:hypothetical protein
MLCLLFRAALYQLIFVLHYKLLFHLEIECFSAYTVTACCHLDFSWEICPMEQRALKNVNNCLNTNIYSYLETPGGQSYILYYNVVHFFNTSAN